MRSGQRKILFVFNHGAIGLRCDLIDFLSKNGYECYCALPEAVIALWAEKYPSIHFVVLRSFSGVSTGIVGNFRIYLGIKNLMKQLCPDVVFLGNVKPNIFGGIAAFQCGIKNIFGLISGLGYAFIEESGMKRAIIKRICMLLYRLSFIHFNHVFFQNPDDRSLFIKNRIMTRERSSVVLGTGVDLKKFYPAPFPEIMTFLMVARFIKEKGVFLFSEAARELRKKYPHVRFLLGGYCDGNPSVITKKQLESCSRFVEYIGYVEDMRETLSKCSVFVYPSYYREGVPRALLEALACGRPVVTTDNVGCREVVVENENGFKVPVKNALALKEAMEKLIVEPSKIPAFGVKSRKLAENKFDIASVNKKILHRMELFC